MPDALGSIIAAIITHHMVKTSAACGGDHVATAIVTDPMLSAIPISPPDPLGSAAASVQAHAARVTSARPEATTSLSRRSAASITDVCSTLVPPPCRPGSRAAAHGVGA